MSATPAKAKKAAKPRKVANHPKYIEMVSAAITSLKERGGSSRQAILKYIMAKYNVGAEAVLVNSHLKLALKRGVQTGALKQAKGTGAAGSFRVGEKKPAAKKAAQPKKAKSPKKVKAKKPAGEKKAAKPKKTKSPKKAKSPAKPKKAKTAPKKAKAAAKTKKPKTPKKKPAAKKSPKKAPKKAAKK